MDNSLGLLLLGFSITLVDIDNAMYTTGQISRLPAHRRLFLLTSLLLEFIGRIGLLYLFALLTNETEPLFSIFGIPVTIESLSLFIAGFYLMISNGRELSGHFRDDQEKPASAINEKIKKSTPRLLLEMTIVLSVMSVDTILVILGMDVSFGEVLFLLLFSALIRLFFVERLVHIIQHYPALQVLILFILVFIGGELILQGFGYDSEIYINIGLIIGIIIFTLYSRRKAIQSENP